jgi:hypothetical protein
MAEIETCAKPSLLYRYRPLGIRKTASGSVRADPAIIDRELGAIEERYVFCPTYPEMNDPMEGICASTRRVQEKSYYQDFVEDVQNEKLSLGIASFSETWDNELVGALRGRLPRDMRCLHCREASRRLSRSGCFSGSRRLWRPTLQSQPFRAPQSGAVASNPLNQEPEVELRARMAPLRFHTRKGRPY